MKNIGIFIATVALLILSCEAALYHYKVKCEKPTHAYYDYTKASCAGEPEIKYGFTSGKCLPTPNSISIFDSIKGVVSTDGSVTLNKYNTTTCAATPEATDALQLNTCKDYSVGSGMVKNLSVPLATYEWEDEDCAGDYSSTYTTRMENGVCTDAMQVWCSDDLQTYNIKTYEINDALCEGEPKIDEKNLKVDKCYNSLNANSASTLSVVSTFIVMVFTILCC